jgi:hypothetical protein
VLRPVQHHVELQRADRGQHRGLIAAQVGGEDLDDAFGVQLLDPAPELLVPAGFHAAHHREMLGREAGDGRELHRRVPGGGDSEVTAPSRRRTPKFGRAAPNSTGLDTPARNDSISIPGSPEVPTDP